MRLLRTTPPSAIHECGRLNAIRLFSRIVAFTVLFLIVSSFFVPWTQTVTGRGKVIALDPGDRQTPVRASVDGRVMQWFVTEGDSVVAGQVLAEVVDNDPNILGRLERSMEAVRAEKLSLQLSVGIAEEQLEALAEARDAALSNAKLGVSIAQENRDAIGQKVIAAEAKADASRLNLKRQTSLREKGLVSDRDLELAQLSMKTSLSELDQATAALRAAEHRVLASRSVVEEVRASNRAKIEKAGSELEKLRANVSQVLTKLASAEIKLSQQQQMNIKAPKSGRILSINSRAGSEFVKAGTSLAIIVPDTTARAVEIVVDGNNAPLISKGRKVRLQFEGWPAVQFVGWPSVAVGTFGGEVAFMDYSAREDGSFRVVIVPDEDDTEWPEGMYLRQGALAKGWILLNRVSIAYEIWRELNNFPVSGTAPPEKVKLKRAKQ